MNLCQGNVICSGPKANENDANYEEGEVKCSGAAYWVGAIKRDTGGSFMQLREQV